MDESDNSENSTYHFKTCLPLMFEDEMWNLSLIHSPRPRPWSAMLQAVLWSLNVTYSMTLRSHLASFCAPAFSLAHHEATLKRKWAYVTQNSAWLFATSALFCIRECISAIHPNKSPYYSLSRLLWIYLISSWLSSPLFYKVEFLRWSTLPSGEFPLSNSSLWGRARAGILKIMNARKERTTSRRKTWPGWRGQDILPCSLEASVLHEALFFFFFF